MALRNAQVSLTLNVLSSNKERPSRSKGARHRITSPRRRITHTSVPFRLSQNGLQCQEARSQRRRGVVPTRQPKVLLHEFLAKDSEVFCLSTHVLASVPTPPNPTIYGLHLYHTCTFSVLFRRKTRPNRPADGEPVFARANPQVGRRKPVNPAKMLPRIWPPEIPPVLAARAKDGEDAYPTPKNARNGRFRPQETAF